MNNKDWFRKQTWTKEDEEFFFLKLNRVRHRDMQAQYLMVQAIVLVDTHVETLLKVAETLVTKLLSDYSEIQTYKSSALNTLGDIYMFYGDYPKAIDYYRQAIHFEAHFPCRISSAYLNFSEWVVKTNRIDLYDEVEKVFSEERYHHDFFPNVRYKKYSVLSIIRRHNGDMERANYYAGLAEESVFMRSSGLNKHQGLGLVKERDKMLDELMQANNCEKPQ